MIDGQRHVEWNGNYGHDAEQQEQMRDQYLRLEIEGTLRSWHRIIIHKDGGHADDISRGQISEEM